MENEFYTVDSEYQENGNKFLSRFNLRYIIFGVLFLALVFISFIIIRSMIGSGAREVREVERIVSDVCSEAEDPELCRFDNLVRMSNSRGNVSICTNLEDESDVISCVNEYALSSMDTDSCLVLRGQERFDCMDRIYLRLALNEGSFEYCQMINDQDRRQSCGISLAIGRADEGVCDFNNEWLNVCEERLNRENLLLSISNVLDCEIFNEGDISDEDDGRDIDNDVYEECLEMFEGREVEQEEVDSEGDFSDSE